MRVCERYHRRVALLRSRRGQRAVVAAAAAALLLGVLGGPYLVSSPSMCASCHHTRPAVSTWRTSSHRKVHCLECHAEVSVPRDPLGRARACLQAAGRFAAGGSTGQQMATDSGLCTRGGCHDATPRETTLQDGGFAFDHRRHLETERETVELSCISCHPRSAHSPAPGPARETCALCHHADMAASASPERCTDCHPRPIGIRKGGLPHDDLGPAGEDCLLCHGTVYSGGMEAPRERCLEHMSARDYEQFDTLPSLGHYVTVTERGVACFDCHERPKHGSSRRPVPRTVEEARGGG